MSIPDYSLTPFAKDLDRGKIAKEIDVFNNVNKAVSIQYKVQYLDITSQNRSASSEQGLVASDGLHPSATEYAKWAKGLTELIAAQLK
jgi:lysophospholipase L1-like esterase